MIQNEFASIIKKERVSASKKTKTEIIAKPNKCINFGEELPFFVDLENLNLSITMNNKRSLNPLVPNVH